MSYIAMSAVGRSRFRSTLWWLLLLALIFSVGFVALENYVNNVYTKKGVESYEELTEIRWAWDDHKAVRNARKAQAAMGFVVTLLFGLIVQTLFAWRQKIQITLDDSGYGTHLRHRWQSSIWGWRENSFPLDRITKVESGQSLSDRVLGIGTVTIHFSTFNLNKVERSAATISGVENPEHWIRQIEKAIRPHQGMLLAFKEERQ